MKVIYKLYSDQGPYKYPALVLAIQEVFETVANTPWVKYFDRPVTVHIFPGPIPGGPNMRAAYMTAEIIKESPQFFFAISPLNAQFALQAYISEKAIGGPAANATHAMRAVVGHEIGHWILEKSLAKFKRYGKSVAVAHSLITHKRTDKLDQEIIFNQMTDYTTQLEYRELYGERWADRISRILLSKMTNNGKELMPSVERPII